MNEKNRLKILIGALCVVLLLVTIVVAVTLGSQLPDPVLDVSRTNPTDTETQSCTEETDSFTQETENTEPADTKPRDPTEETDSATRETENTEPMDTEPQDPTEETDSATRETENTEPADTKPQDPTEETDNSAQETENTDPVDTDPQEPTEETDDPTQETENTDPPEKDIETDEEMGVLFPYQVPEYDMTIEKMGPYSGMFVEDGTNTNSENVAMLLVKNNGDSPVEYAQIRVMCEQEELLFDISALPVGERLVVQEKTGKTISESKATSVSALVVQRANMEMSESKVQVTDNGNNTLTVKNLTKETIPTVRIFYKYYMEDEKLFVGGIAFTVRIARLGAGASVTIQPSHYTSQTSRVVMVLTYDSEV